MKVEHLLKVLDFFVWGKKHLIKMTFVNKGRRPERRNKSQICELFYTCFVCNQITNVYICMQIAESNNENIISRED